MFLDLLHFGDGPQAIHYFVLCLVAVLGTIQGVATYYHRRDLIWIDGQAGYWLSGLLIAGSFIWFFLTDQEIFIPGLAGGELFTIFVVAFIISVPLTRFVAFSLMSLRARRGNLQLDWGLLRRFTPRNGKSSREKEPLI